MIIEQPSFIKMGWVGEWFYKTTFDNILCTPVQIKKMAPGEKKNMASLVPALSCSHLP